MISFFFPTGSSWWPQTTELWVKRFRNIPSTLNSLWLCPHLYLITLLPLRGNSAGLHHANALWVSVAPVDKSVVSDEAFVLTDGVCLCCLWRRPEARGQTSVDWAPDACPPTEDCCDILKEARPHMEHPLTGGLGTSQVPPVSLPP